MTPAALLLVLLLLALVGLLGLYLKFNELKTQHRILLAKQEKLQERYGGIADVDAEAIRLQRQIARSRRELDTLNDQYQEAKARSEQLQGETVPKEAGVVMGKCPECGYPMSSRAKRCVNCDTPNAKMINPRRESALQRISWPATGSSLRRPRQVGTYYHGTHCPRCRSVISPSAVRCPGCGKFFGLIGAERSQSILGMPHFLGV